MPNAARRPAVRTACLLTVSILCAESVPTCPAVSFLAGILLLIAVAIVGRYSDRRVLSSVLLQAAFSALIVSWHAGGRADAADSHVGSSDGREIVLLKGVADSDPVRSERTISFVLRVDSIPRSGERLERDARLMIVVRSAGEKGFSQPLHAGDRAIVSGSLLRFPGPRNPGDFDYGRFLELKGISGVVLAASPDSVQLFGKGTDHSWRSLVSRVQRALFAVFDTLHPPEHASFLKGVVWGHRAEIRDDVRQSFINTGTIHILAVSGSNVAFVVMALGAALGLVRVRRRFRDGMSAVGLLAYMVLTGASASVVRATVMGLIVLAGKGLERRTDVYNSIAAATVVLLLWDTNTLFDVGFQLSFSAVLSLVYFSGPLNGLLRRLTERFEEIKPLNAVMTLFTVSLAAQIGTVPFTGYYFGRVSVVSLLANLVVVPVSGVNTIIGFVEVLCFLVSPGLASCYAAVNDALVWFLLGFVRTAAAVPGATVAIGGLTVGYVVLYYALVLGLFNLHRPGIAKVLLFGTLLGSTGWVIRSIAIAPRPVVTVTVLDVGQGDAILIETPAKRRMLIDTGPGGRGSDAGERTIVPFLRRAGIGELESVVITHAHDDHTGGLASVLRELQVNRLLKGVGTQLPGRMQAALVEAVDRGLVIDSLASGDRIDLDPDLRIYVIAPTVKLASARNLNARSVALRIVHGGATMILTGDLDQEGEDGVAQVYSGFLHSDILKVGHHGSATSTLPPFLELVRPHTAILSVGEWNRFGHPSATTLGRLVNDTVAVVRTDREGAIVFESDGTSWSRIHWR